MGKCIHCGKESGLVSQFLGLCRECILKDFQIAEFVAGLDPDIPYALLGFHPHFYFRDMPVTSRRHAEKSRQAAEEAGLRNVRIGNVHLLGKEY